MGEVIENSALPLLLLGFYPLVRLLSDTMTELSPEATTGLMVSGLAFSLLPKILEFLWGGAFAFSMVTLYRSVRK